MKLYKIKCALQDGILTWDKNVLFRGANDKIFRKIGTSGQLYGFGFLLDEVYELEPESLTPEEKKLILQYLATL